MKEIQKTPLSIVFCVLLMSASSGLRIWATELPSNSLSALQSLDFRQRETAEKEILDWGRKRPEEAMTELLRQSRSAEDPEVRERCLGVLRELVNDEYLKDGEGYLGIQRQDAIALVPGELKPRTLVAVAAVVPDSAAQRGGLLPQDLIASMDGEQWQDGPVSEKFAEKVKSMKPNTKVVLKVLRDGKLLDINVTLGRRPVSLENAPFFNGLGPDLQALERSAKEEYFRRWLSKRNVSE